MGKHVETKRNPTLNEELDEALRHILSLDKKQTFEEETRLREDLRVDSLDCVELVMYVEDQHCIEIDDDTVSTFVTVGDLRAYVAKKVAAA